MKTKAKGERTNRQKAMLGLPDLEHAKSAVLVSLRSPESQLSYRRSIDFFVRWYCSERRNLNMSLFLESKDPFVQKKRRKFADSPFSRQKRRVT